MPAGFLTKSGEKSRSISHKRFFVLRGKEMLFVWGGGEEGEGRRAELEPLPEPPPGNTASRRCRYYSGYSEGVPSGYKGKMVVSEVTAVHLDGKTFHATTKNRMWKFTAGTVGVCFDLNLS